mmetsp:Transcript_109706/g.354204  ORF Transcript_109706/g.354204 Transcript_109706/m.354204 type:complete len:204 (-) Transcript_109706:259-870(-)
MGIAGPKEPQPKDAKAGCRAAGYGAGSFKPSAAMSTEASRAPSGWRQTFSMYSETQAIMPPCPITVSAAPTKKNVALLPRSRAAAQYLSSSRVRVNSMSWLALRMASPNSWASSITCIPPLQMDAKLSVATTTTSKTWERRNCIRKVSFTISSTKPMDVGPAIISTLRRQPELRSPEPSLVAATRQERARAHRSAREVAAKGR